MTGEQPVYRTNADAVSDAIGGTFGMLTGNPYIALALTQGVGVLLNAVGTRRKKKTSAPVA